MLETSEVGTIIMRVDDRDAVARGNGPRKKEAITCNGKQPLDSIRISQRAKTRSATYYCFRTEEIDGIKDTGAAEDEGEGGEHEACFCSYNSRRTTLVHVATCLLYDLDF